MSTPSKAAKEKWKVIRGYERYQVSNMGRVKSLINPEIRILKPSIQYGYYRVCLWGVSGRGQYLVHRLVLDAFVGPRPDGKETSHINENRLDNRVINLCYETPKENCSRGLFSLRNSRNNHIGKTGYRGVTLRKWDGRYSAHCDVRGKQKYLGLFCDLRKAALVYDSYVIENNLIKVTNKELGLL